MNTLDIRLENCYGIKKLKHKLEFEDNKNTFLIYAPNGTMKTSLAKTFEELSQGREPKELAYGRTPVCIINIDSGSIQRENILVIKSTTENNFTTEKMDLLLINKEEQAKFQEIRKQLIENEESFLKKLATISGCKKTELKDIISKKTNPKIDEFYTILGEFKTRVELDSEKYLELKGLKYSKIFTADSEKFMETAEFKSFIEEYMHRYNTIISASNFFSKDIGFVPHNAEAVEIAVRKNKFLLVDDNALIFAGRKEPIKTQEDLEQAIKDELKSIREDEKLKDTFEKFHNKFTNESLRTFRDYLADNPVTITKLVDKEGFKKDLLTCYFIELQDLYLNLINEYYAKQKEIKVIKEKSLEEETLWYKAKKTFKDRFTLPIEIEIEDVQDMIYGGDNFKGFKFYFKPEDELEESPIEKKRDELTNQILSRGEARALYLLNMLFEIEARMTADQETLLVIDDIADSFDYQNKYAIIEYLHDLSKNKKFKMLILTHNFDFYRTVKSRLNINDDYSMHAIKNRNGISLEKGLTAKNIFNNWINGLKQGKISNSKLIALVPFFRNLCEYEIFDDANFKKYDFFTSLLHIKKDVENDTNKITVKRLEDELRSLCKLIPDGKSFINEKRAATKLFKDLVYETVQQDIPTNSECIDLDKKITLAIAIRLKAEEYMIDRITDGDGSFDFGQIHEKQTRILTDKFKDLFKSEKNTIDKLDKVNIMTPENIHLNSFMFEPILDMSIIKLGELYKSISALHQSSVKTETSSGS